MRQQTEQEIIAAVLIYRRNYFLCETRRIKEALQRKYPIVAHRICTYTEYIEMKIKKL